MLCSQGREDGSRLGVKVLDDLLEVFMSRPPTGQGEESQARKESNPVVEIASTASAAGKSQLLYYLTAIAVLPETLHDARIGGQDAAVVYIDANGRFDADRLRVVARGVVHQRLLQATTTGVTTPYDGDIEDLLISSLQHVHVFRPPSSTSLLASLQTLHTYLLDTSRHLSSAKPLHAIFLDSATAFLWQDKLRDQIARVEEIGRPHVEIERERRENRVFVLGGFYAELVAELKRLQGVLGCAVIYTVTAWVRAGAGAGGDDAVGFRSSLPPPWGLFPRLRVVIRSIGHGRFVGCVNTWGREDWPRRVIEGLEQRHNGVFSFYADKDGVVLPAR